MSRLRLRALLFALAGAMTGACAAGEPGAQPSDGGAAACEPAEEVCGALFGRPNPATGLSEEDCRPRLDCDGQSWEAPVYDAAFVAKLRAYTLSEPYAALTDNPYLSPAPLVRPEAVCAAVFDDPDPRRYRLADYDSKAAALEAGAQVTHFGRCGVCSTLTDLAVYIEVEDLTEPVRSCGLAHLRGPPEAHLECLLGLGFTEPCAQIWYYNTRNTRSACAEPCFAALGEPYHRPNGELNECLRCDEDQSGEVFKAIAGRTRRNTGLPNAICRPCAESQPLVHDYP